MRELYVKLSDAISIEFHCKIETQNKYISTKTRWHCVITCNVDSLYSIKMYNLLFVPILVFHTNYVFSTVDVTKKCIPLPARVVTKRYLTRDIKQPK